MKNPEKYIETVVQLDFGRPLDELIALVLVACGHPPPAKPYSVTSEWKTAANRILVDSVPGAQRAKVTGYSHTIVLIALNTARKRWRSPSQLLAYAQQIKAARRPWA